jgi:hypothetical protein
MAVMRPLRRRLRYLARSERGIALPVALFATVAAMGLGSVAVLSSIDVQQGSQRDNSSKSAIAAADAGANVALQRQNRYATSLDAEHPCLNVGSGGKLEPGAQAATEPGWCAPISGEVGGSTYSYRVSTVGGVCGGHEVCVVSTGTAATVSRRIELSLDQAGIGTPASSTQLEEELGKATEGKELTAKELKELEERLKAEILANEHGGSVAGLVGKDEITVSGNGDIRVGVGTNGNLVTSGNASICGSIQVGIGKKWTKSGNAKQCSGYTFTEGTQTPPEVSSFIPADIATHNSNGRITMCSKGLPAECQKDTYTGDSWSSTSPFKPSNRSISLSGNTTLTVGGGDYWLCSLTMSGNSKLIMASGSHVRFFFDTPEHCGTSSQISMSGNNEITATGYKPGVGQFDMPGFYLLGSTSWVSQVDLSGNNSTTDEFVIYGPNSYVNISGNATFKGIVAGKRIAMSGNGKIEQDAGFSAPAEIRPAGDGSAVKKLEELFSQKKLDLESKELILQQIQKLLEGGTGSQAFHAGGYVECTGLPTAGQAPNSDC